MEGLDALSSGVALDGVYSRTRTEDSWPVFYAFLKELYLYVVQSYARDCMLPTATRVSQRYGKTWVKLSTDHGMSISLFSYLIEANAFGFPLSVLNPRGDRRALATPVLDRLQLLAAMRGKLSCEPADVWSGAKPGYEITENVKRDLNEEFALVRSLESRP